MTTTQPIAGNQFFKEVFNQAGQLPILQVEDLEIGTATTGFLEVVRTNVNLGTNYLGLGAAVSKDPSNIRLTLDNFGHILTAQQVPPVVVAASDGTLGSSFTASVTPNSTDTAGQVQLRWDQPGLPPNAACFTRIEFNREFPSKDLSVQLTAANDRAGQLVSGEWSGGGGGTFGVYVTTGPNFFQINFDVDPNGLEDGASPLFNYFVTDPVAL